MYRNENEHIVQSWKLTSRLFLFGETVFQILVRKQILAESGFEFGGDRGIRLLPRNRGTEKLCGNPIIKRSKAKNSFAERFRGRTLEILLLQRVHRRCRSLPFD